MKNISLKLKLFLVIIIIYLITYNYLIKIGISSNLYNILFWGIFFVLSYCLLSYTKNKAIIKKQTIQYVIIYCIIYLLLMYFLGIITGFYYSPFSHSIKNIFLNILPIIIIIILKELSRYILIFKGRFNKKYIILITIIYILSDIIPVINMYEFSTGLLIFTFIGEVCIKAIYNNILQSIMCYNTGPIPGIVYRIILDCYIYLVPIVPNLGVYLNSIINALLPILLILKLNKLNYNYKNVSKKQVGIPRKYIIIPIAIVLIIMISLTSGIFSYKIIAVASNSMVPTFARGDAVIYEKITSVEELKEGDILVLQHDDVLYIHRIAEISKLNKQMVIYTKGDNNADRDAFATSESDIVGVVRTKVKYIGYPSVWLSELM